MIMSLHTEIRIRRLRSDKNHKAKAPLKNIPRRGTWSSRTRPSEETIARRTNKRRPLPTSNRRQGQAPGNPSQVIACTASVHGARLMPLADARSQVGFLRRIFRRCKIHSSLDVSGRCPPHRRCDAEHHVTRFA